MGNQDQAGNAGNQPVTDPDTAITPQESGLVGPGLDAGGLPTLHSFQEQFAFSGVLPNPILNKLNDDHITSLIHHDGEEGKRAFITNLVRIIALVVVLLVVLAFIVLFCWLFSSQTDLVEKVLIGVISFAGGIGTGLGARAVIGNDD